MPAPNTASLLLGLMLIGCWLKYPFLEFGPRYAAATGEHMIRGYRRLGRWPLGLFVFLTLASMFIVLASVTLVTAGLAGTLFRLEMPVPMLALIILAVCALILGIGHYRGLDLLMKIIMAVLSLATVVAVALAAGRRPEWSGLMPALARIGGSQRYRTCLCACATGLDAHTAGRGSMAFDLDAGARRPDRHPAQRRARRH